MSWLSRLNPRAPGGRPGRGAAQSAPCTADPETCLMVFENHWRQVSRVLDQSEPSSSTDDLIAVRNHTDQMLCLLAEERPVEASDGAANKRVAGPILSLVVSQDILECLVQWHLRRGLDPDSQGALLKLFEMLIGQSQQPLLQHVAVLHPLLRLLGACADPELGCPAALENSLVLLLNQICVSMARQPVLLEMLFQATPVQQGSTNLLIFSLLVPFIHRDGAIGQQARDALLLVMATSASNDNVARYIAENSYFCPVLATGLSALYSSLPRKIEVRGDDWHALRREDWMAVSSLVLFMNSLEFCNAVVQVAHHMVRSQLLDYLHNGFLVPVMGPALHKSSVDEMIASTAYLDLFLRSVSETALLKTFLRFILLHRLDNDSILDTLLTRISSNSRLCMVSLSLFRTLLSFNCEDIMLQLVLRYLLPCSHVMLSQRRAIREADMYGKCADKFLSLIPECCRLIVATSAERDEETAVRGKVLNNAGAESPAPHRPATPSRLAFFIRQQSSGGGSGGAPTPPNTEPPQPGTPISYSPDSPMHPQQLDSLEWDSGYLDYLKDARQGIELCSWACRGWSAPYDGENPSPSTAPPPPPPPTSNPSMAMFPEHFSFQPGGGSSASLGQQRAAIVAAARSEWSSSDRDSGEWDVTIGQNNCISLTPRSKKRSLQREEVLPKPVPPLVSSSSPVPAATPAPHNPAAIYNGTGEGCSGHEVKKVKRDLGDQQFLDENANQNGSVVTCSSQGQQSLFNKIDTTDAKSASPAPPSETDDASDLNWAPSCDSGRSVQSLIEELLEQSPDETHVPEDSNGEGINIEAFTEELRELEDRVTARSAAACLQVESNAKSPSEERQEQEHRPEDKRESAGTAVCSPARPLNAPSSQPYTGPFVVVLLSKLENMLQNSLYVNILLTGMVAQLACYPQPLLRSFLLNTNMVFQPSVKSLIQVLGSVKNRIEAFAASHEDFPSMLRKAQLYLVARGKVDWAEPPGAVPPLRRSDSLVKSRKSSLSDLILRHTNSPTRTRNAAQMALAHVRVGGQTLHSALFRGGGGSGPASNLEKQAEALRVKNAVYCAVIFCEFLKELAALAQEHAVALPFGGTEE
ncbi:FHF complex subunit HOOK-interacting protein 1B [Entelurus aequoreus]|uniref:FHF complex subunit HOOK-interacting protein 1B n=1 Tax=Entelurus aequoreus TaxID=161455 RepID=UPI002B1D2CE3|nr:FHF complex subunit HOOK-interacting protein 1B [Entelurus aequoreus]XP_061917469.1 FHF complex subunit HOOK-interacting protein 1B [Entelurus aequoreus]XP_061917470.1 FHF complex subunit HOOK-interacting protein 1B [Entelurus aequoreus]